MKRTKRKNIKFTPEEWKAVCKRAEMLKMKKSTFIRNVSLHDVWNVYNADEVCLPLKKINYIGHSLNQIINVAERTNSEYLDEIKNLKRRFEDCRDILYKYYSQLLNDS